MAEEIELKLRLAPADLPRLAVLLARHAEGPASPARRFLTVYYDTPRLELWRGGLALRLRRVGGTWVQSLKGGGGVAGGLHRREERERPVPGPVPDWAAVRDAFPEVATEALVPVFSTEFRRRTFILRHGRARVEAALDKGVIRAGERQEPLLELELERLSGRPEALYDLALALAEEVPLFPEPRSKAERGYALVTGAFLAPVKAETPALPRAATVGEAFGRLLAACLDQIQRNQAGVLNGGDPEFVHQMRVGIRRLRALFSLFREALPAGGRAAFRKELAWLAGELGAARDWDVFAGELLPAFTADRGPAPALERRVAACRRAAGARARAAVASPRYGRLMLGLGRWLLARGWQTRAGGARARLLSAPARRFAAEALAARHEKLLRRGRHLARLNEEKRHRLRIQAKKLRYGAEFLAGLFDARRARRYIKALAGLQDVLGQLNDLALAATHLATLCGRSAPCREDARRFGDWLEGRAGQVVEALPAASRRLRRREPFWED